MSVVERRGVARASPGERGSPAGSLPKPGFDKVAYQREYMRKRRAKAAEEGKR